MVSGEVQTHVRLRSAWGCDRGLPGRRRHPAGVAEGLRQQIRASLRCHGGKSLHRVAGSFKIEQIGSCGCGGAVSHSVPSSGHTDGGGQPLRRCTACPGVEFSTLTQAAVFTSICASGTGLEYGSL
jgi:hypothetical protein